MVRESRQAKSHGLTSGSRLNERRRYRPRVEALEDRTLLATIRWTNPAGGFWHVAGNWDLQRLPGAGDDVVIDLPGNYFVEHGPSGNTDINSFTSAKFFRIFGGQFRVREQIQSTDIFYISSGGNPVELVGGTIAAGTNVRMEGSAITLRGVTLNGNAIMVGGYGQFTVADALTIHGTLRVPSNSRVLFSGGAEVSGSGSIVLDSSEVPVLESVGREPWVIGTGITLRGRTGHLMNFVNRGTIVGEPQGTIRLVNFVNQGTIVTESAGTTRLEGDWRNEGVLRVAGGELALEGIFTVATIGTLERQGGRVAIVGTLDNRRNTLALTAATGSWTLSNGTIRGGIVTAADGATLTGTGTLDGVDLRTDISVLSGSQLTLSGDWINRGTMTLNGGRLRLGGSFTPADLQTIRPLGGGVEIIGTLNNFNNTLRLDPAVNYSLEGGTISGGRVITRAVSGLLALGNSRLNRVSIDGSLVAAGHLQITGGLTFHGNITVGCVSDRCLDFLGTQTMGGTATVVFLGGMNSTGIGATNGLVTFGEGITVRGSNGILRNFVNRGRIEVSGVGFQLGGESWRNEGTIIQNDGLLTLAGRFTTAGLGNFQRSSGQVRVSGILDNTGNTLVLGKATGSWELSGGTIVGGALLTTEGTRLTTDSRNGTLNGVQFDADLTVIFGLRLTGAWANRGTITAASGTLELDGAFTTASLGDIRRTGGTVLITGWLENIGQTLALTSRTGPWVLTRTGTVNGGTVDSSELGRLLLDAGRLHGVTLNGEAEGRAIVTGGLTVHGTLEVRQELSFLGTQTLDGKGTVRFSPFGDNAISSSSGATLTIAAGITVRGNGIIRDVINYGTILGDVPNRGMSLVGNWRNEGLIYLTAGVLGLGGTVTTAGLGTILREAGDIYLTGTLDNRDATLALTPKTQSWYLAGGTIRGGRVTGVGGYTLLPTSNAGTLDGVSLETDVAIPANTQLQLVGTWGNRGQLTLEGGSLFLGGTFNRATLGNLQRTAGTVFITGTLDNTGSTLTLDNTTGSWSLANNGGIQGGIVATAGAARLVVGQNGGRLLGVTVNGTLDVAAGPLTVSNGLTLNGNLLLNQSVRFQGTQTLAGTATVEATAAQGELVGVGGQLTLGSGITLRRAGRLINVTNQGTILVDSPTGTVTLDGTWRNAGQIHLQTGTLTLRGSFVLPDLGDFVRTGGTLNVAGILDLRGGTLALNAITGSWQVSGGTLRNGTVTTSGGAELRFAGAAVSTLDGVTLQTDVQIASTTVLFTGAWSNRGIITINSSGVLQLGGLFTQAMLGTYRSNGGGVVVTGALQNAGQTLALTAQTGSWTLSGGTISGGTITTTGGVALLVNRTGGRLDGVTVTGDLTIQGNLRVHNNLILNGTARLNVVSGSQPALTFEGAQTLGGIGIVLFGSANFNTPIPLQATDGIVTIGAGITVRGGTGRLVNFVNQGEILADADGTALTLDGTNWRNEGRIRVRGGQLLLGGTFTTAALGDFQRTGGAVVLIGTLNNAGSVLTLGPDTGSWNLRRGTINGGTVRSVGGVALLPATEGGTLNGVTLEGDVLVQNDGILTLTGNWSNRGRITLSSGTVNLGGTFRTEALGDLRRTGGTVNLTGTLDNTGSHLQLNGAAESWRLAGGTILRGTVSTTRGARLFADGPSGSRLIDLTLNGNLDVYGATVQVQGLTVNGTVTLGRGAAHGALLFATSTTLGGMVLIQFTGSDPARTGLAVTGFGETLTLGPDVMVRGGGTIGYVAAWSGNVTGIRVINQGTVSAEVADQVLTVAATTLINQGVWRALNNGLLALQRRDPAGILVNFGVMLLDGSTITTNGPVTQWGGELILRDGIFITPLLDLRGGTLAGSGVLEGSVHNDALVQVGFADARGTLSITGDYRQGSAGVLAMTLGGLKPGLTYDQLRVGGVATLDGTLALTVLEDFFADPGDTFTLMEFRSRVGEFGAYEGLEPLGQEIHFDPFFDENTFTLVAVPN